ncbi:GH25 family lysozyme [Clostridium sp. JNZ X4-2]
MLKGIDISNLNGNVDMNLLKNAGYQFVFCRATEGTSGSGSRDEKYHQNIENAKKAELLTGAYHFSHFADKAKELTEIANFLDFIKGTDPDIVILDCENSCTGNMTDLCVDFLDKASKEAQPLFYANPSWIKAHLNSRINEYPLWIAHYGVSKPSFTLWDNYSIWQYTDKGRISGIGGYLDLNYMTEDFYKSLSDTRQLNPLIEQIKALQYNLNVDYNAKLDMDGMAGKATMAALKGIQNVIVKGHKSYVILWIQQKLEGYGYLQKDSYTPMLYDEPTFQAVTNLQRAWGRPIDGVLRIETWSIFLNN